MPLLRHLQPVARNLASPKTDLGGFLRGLEAFSGALAPVAGTNASLFANLDGTFRALASVSTPFLQQTISNTPPLFATVIADSRFASRACVETRDLDGVHPLSSDFDWLTQRDDRRMWPVRIDLD